MYVVKTTSAGHSAFNYYHPIYDHWVRVTQQFPNTSTLLCHVEKLNKNHGSYSPRAGDTDQILMQQHSLTNNKIVFFTHFNRLLHQITNILKKQIDLIQSMQERLTWIENKTMQTILDCFLLCSRSFVWLACFNSISVQSANKRSNNDPHTWDWYSWWGCHSSTTCANIHSINN